MKKRSREVNLSMWCLFFIIVLLLFRNLPAATYDFTGNFDIWDISGNYEDDSLGIDFDYDITQDEKGKLTGAGSFSGTLYGVDFESDFTVKGTITQSNGIACVKMTLKHKLWISDGWDEWKGTATENVSAVINTNTFDIEGTVRVSIAGLGSDTVDFFESLPGGMDGAVEATFNIGLNAKKLAISGNWVISNGDIMVFNGTGSYTVKTDTDKFTVKGSGITVTVVSNHTTGLIEKISGTCMGQKFKASNISVE
jgi:hypothetical protein